jgi:hypothetical protein
MSRSLGLSLSRTNQIINSVKVFDNITGTFPQDAVLLSKANEHMLRPLTRLEPELQTATWELIRALSKEPDASIIQEVVDWLKDAVATGWHNAHFFLCHAVRATSSIATAASTCT